MRDDRPHGRLLARHPIYPFRWAPLVGEGCPAVGDTRRSGPGQLVDLRRRGKTVMGAPERRRVLPPKTGAAERRLEFQAGGHPAGEELGAHVGQVREPHPFEFAAHEHVLHERDVDAGAGRIAVGVDRPALEFGDRPSTGRTFRCWDRPRWRSPSHGAPSRRVRGRRQGAHQGHEAAHDTARSRAQRTEVGDLHGAVGMRRRHTVGPSPGRRAAPASPRPVRPARCGL